MENESTKQYRRRRLIIILIEYVSLIGVICTYMFSFCTMFAVEDLKMGLDVKFTDSITYVKLVEEELRLLHDYLESASNFEDNGTYDPDKVVDIQEYALTNLISGGETSSVGYRLKDLLRWSQTGLRKTSGEKKSGTSPYVEEYLSVNGVSIWEYAKEEEEEAQIYYNYLENVLNKVWESAWNYNKLKARFQQSNTNISYKVLCPDGNTIRGNSKKSENEIKEMGTFFVVDYRNMSLDHNIDIGESFYDEIVKSISPSFSECTLYVGIDTSFPQSDSFQEMELRYNIWKPWNTVCILALAFFIFVWLFSLHFVRTLADGNGPNGKLQLKSYDKLPYELMCLQFLGTLAGSFWLAWLSYKRLEIFPGIFGVLFALDGFANGSFIVFMVSTVRRFKAGTLLENSWIIANYKRIVVFFRSKKTPVATVVFFAFIIGLNGLCFTFAGHWLILLFFIDSAFGIVITAHSVQEKKIQKGMQEILKGNLNYKLNTKYFMGINREVGDSLNILGDSIREAVDSNIKNERLKTELITNVSHDIKTPLTSIINYIDLLKRRRLSDEQANAYLAVLDDKSQRLKKLTDDLLEVSRISSGNVVLECTKINIQELVNQTNGEFIEQFEEKKLQLVVSMPQNPVFIKVDSAKVWRIIENIYSNVVKYALSGTRVYIDVFESEGKVRFSVKNISEKELRINPDELIGRFVRGEKDRSVEGSGLGLAIAKDLTELHGGEFYLQLDGDLFKIMISFPVAE